MEFRQIRRNIPLILIATKINQLSALLLLVLQEILPKKRYFLHFLLFIMRVASRRYVPCLSSFVQVFINCLDSMGLTKLCLFLMQYFTIFGYARSKMTDAELRNMVSKTLTCRIDKRCDLIWSVTYIIPIFFVLHIGHLLFLHLLFWAMECLP